ncbi:MAG: ribonuclease P protein component [Bacteroidales bacterium]|nr:ribonuclease P protein component [Bacteroidales bacterium]
MQSFNKEERLRSKKLIEKLFAEGQSFKIFPFRVIWLNADTGTGAAASLLISVPAKRIRKAVQRNLIRRRIREAYRKNKQIFYSTLAERGRKCVFAVIYLSGETIDYKETEGKIISLLNRLKMEYENIDR